jgi:hypothetical protein
LGHGPGLHPFPYLAPQVRLFGGHAAVAQRTEVEAGHLRLRSMALAALPVQHGNNFAFEVIAGRLGRENNQRNTEELAMEHVLTVLSDSAPTKRTIDATRWRVYSFVIRLS